MNNQGENIYLWNNLTPQDNNWLKVKLEGVQSNRMGIGSWIEIGTGDHVQYNYTVCGEGYLSQNSAAEFFGLGDATIVDYVKVTWLSGAIDYFEDVAVNQMLEIVEGSSPLSVEDQLLNDMVIYPNPAQDILNIKLTSAESATVTIFDLNGRAVLTSSLTEPQTRLAIDRLQAGVYVVEVTGEVGIIVEKLIKK